MKFLDLFETVEILSDNKVEFPLDILSPGYKRGFAMVNSTDVFYPMKDMLKIETYEINLNNLEKLAARMVFAILSRQDTYMKKTTNQTWTLCN